MQRLYEGIHSHTRFVEIVTPHGAKFLQEASVLGTGIITAAHGVGWGYHGDSYLAPNLKGCLHYVDTLMGAGLSPHEPPNMLRA